MRSPPPGDLPRKLVESTKVSVKLRMRFFREYIKSKFFCAQNLKVSVILKIYSISFHTVYSVYLMLCWCFLNVLPITQKTDLFNLWWLLYSIKITSIYCTKKVSSHYWWSRSILYSIYTSVFQVDPLITQMEASNNPLNGHFFKKQSCQFSCGRFAATLFFPQHSAQPSTGKHHKLKMYMFLFFGMASPMDCLEEVLERCISSKLKIDIYQAG